MGARRERKPATLATVRRHALALPGADEGSSYGTPAFRVCRKLIARMHQIEAAVVIRVDRDTRELLMQGDPETFFITDHYREHPWVLVRLATVDDEALGGCWSRRGAGSRRSGCWTGTTARISERYLHQKTVIFSMFTVSLRLRSRVSSNR